MKNKLFVFSDAFYTTNYDQYNHGVVAAIDEEDAQRLVPTGIDLIEVGETDAYDVLLFAEGVRNWPERHRYTNHTINCPGWKVIEGADISDYEKKLVELMQLPPDMDIVFSNWGKVPEDSEHGKPPAAGQWTITATSGELGGSAQVHFNGLPSLDALLEPAEHTVSYTWQDTETLPVTIEHVLADVLKVVGRESEYHDWAGMARQHFYSETAVLGWEELTEEIGQYKKTWYRHPDWQTLVPEMVRKEASKLTVITDENGRMRMAQY
ncbi:hypothetical protein G173_gp151 [Erwinia phage phiEaH2]|uniref:Uncharacterized protein n=1 Tax=Erwinia phage phiEaH2 TaxID=1029988 RepID=J7KCD2_9CAUD|nr:hypothetical protein G173_gp151 [Erwinia phage phiEaH2]AFQ96696.1 hypothetical protein [Erwinia phage phiEaH2]